VTLAPAAGAHGASFRSGVGRVGGWG